MPHETLTAIESSDVYEAKSLIGKLHDLSPTAREMLFDERATLPPVFFQCLHDLHKHAGIFHNLCDSVSKGPKEKEAFRINQLKDSYQEIGDCILDAGGCVGNRLPQ